MHLGWHWFKAIEPETQKIVGLTPNLLEFVLVWTWPQTHNLLSLGLDLIICQKNRHAILDGCSRNREQSGAKSRISKSGSSNEQEPQTRKIVGLRPNWPKLFLVWIWPGTHTLLGLVLGFCVARHRTRAPNLENCGFQAQLVRICFCVGSA